jgi:hypothetical protein
MRRISVWFGVLAIAAVAATPAWAQRGGGRGGRGGGGLMLLTQDSVQAELKLSDDQKKQLGDELAKQREAFSGLQDLSREERQTKFAELQKEGQAAIGKVLNAEQQTRLKQITLQQRGPQALADAEVATAVGLTDEQKQKVEAISQEVRGAMREAFQGGGGGGEAREKLEALRKSSGEKIQALLTPEQQAKWKELTGEPFKGELRPFGGGRRGAQRGGAPEGNAAFGRNPFRFASFAEDTASDDKPAEVQGGHKKDGAKAGQHSGKRHHKYHAYGGKARGSEQARHRHHGSQRYGVQGHGRHRGHHGPALAGRGAGGPNAAAWGRVARAMGPSHRGHFAHRAGGRGHGFSHAGFHRGPSAWGPHPWDRHFAGRGPGRFGHHGQFGPPSFHHRSEGFAARGSHGHHGHHGHYDHHGYGHHFASWRPHHERGPQHFEHRHHGWSEGRDYGDRPRHPRDGRDGGRPDRERSEAAGVEQGLTQVTPEASAEVDSRIAQLQESLSRLGEELASLRQALKR